MRPPFIVVIRFSASFVEFSRQLSESLGIEFRSLSPSDVNAVPRAAAVLLSAGGAERDAIEWLESREPQDGVPLFLAGSDTGRRTASRAVAHGATDYFALPEDVELLHHALEAAIAQHQGGQGTIEDRADTDLNAFSALAGESAAVRATIVRAALQRIREKQAWRRLILAGFGRQ